MGLALIAVIETIDKMDSSNKIIAFVAIVVAMLLLVAWQLGKRQ